MLSETSGRVNEWENNAPLLGPGDGLVDVDDRAAKAVGEGGDADEVEAELVGHFFDGSEPVGGGGVSFSVEEVDAFGVLERLTGLLAREGEWGRIGEAEDLADSDFAGGEEGEVVGEAPVAGEWLRYVVGEKPGCELVMGGGEEADAAGGGEGLMVAEVVAEVLAELERGEEGEHDKGAPGEDLGAPRPGEGVRGLDGFDQSAE